ncbi:hypothetical protein MRX96_005301 [Rhipicephalus microplus]
MDGAVRGEVANSRSSLVTRARPIQVALRADPWADEARATWQRSALSNVVANQSEGRPAHGWSRALIVNCGPRETFIATVAEHTRPCNSIGAATPGVLLSARCNSYAFAKAAQMTDLPPTARAGGQLGGIPAVEWTVSSRP